MPMRLRYVYILMPHSVFHIKPTVRLQPAGMSNGSSCSQYYNNYNIWIRRQRPVRQHPLMSPPLIFPAFAAYQIVSVRAANLLQAALDVLDPLGETAVVSSPPAFSALHVLLPEKSGCIFKHSLIFDMFQFLAFRLHKPVRSGAFRQESENFLLMVSTVHWTRMSPPSGPMSVLAGTEP